MAQSHLFILDTWKSLSYGKDSSLAVAYLLEKQGHQIYCCQDAHLSQSWNKKSPVALCQKMSFSDPKEKPSLGGQELKELTQFQTIQVRKEPPVDFNYFTMTYILGSVEDQVRVYNSPRALRDFNEKLTLFDFPQLSIPSLVSLSEDLILDFVENNCQNDIIIKPLQHFGGLGVKRFNLSKLKKTEKKKALQEIVQESQQPYLYQPFLKEIFEGEVRVFTCAGKPISWCKKIPSPGSFLANTGRGSKLATYTPKKELETQITKAATSLYQKGITFAGFDLIGGLISEINVTSPRLLTVSGDDLTAYKPIIEEIIKD